jgi:hypothetical protein
MVYIGHFVYVSNQQEASENERRHGDFDLIVEAESSEEAVTRFRERVVAYRNSDKFFEGECKIYFINLIEFNQFPQARAFMLNFKSFAGDPILPHIECTIPSESTDGCKISDWAGASPTIDGKPEHVFLEFSR